MVMHIDDGKKFDKRNIEKNVKDGIITQKDYEIYLSKLPDVSHKIYIPEECSDDSKEQRSGSDEKIIKKQDVKKKRRGK